MKENGKKILCDNCGEELSEECFYLSQYGGTQLCEECGDDMLCWCEDIRAYVNNDEYQDNYLDDDLSDLEIYDKYVLVGNNYVKEER